MKLRTLLVFFYAVLAMTSVPGYAETLRYYITYDKQETLTFGAYTGLPNPNHGRMTWLVYPGDHAEPSGAHYHSIGAYSYVGEVGSAVVNTTSGNNRLPETHTSQAPLTLVPGTAAWSGKLTSLGNTEKYGELNVRSTHALSGFEDGSLEAYLYNSSSGRWNGSLGDADIWIELVSKSPGLNIGVDGDQIVLASAGDMYSLGAGDTLAFQPIFWTEESAAPGQYSAEFRLLDRGEALGRTPFLSSGTFNFDFAVVPEPSAIGLVVVGAFGLAALRQRRRESDV